MTEINPSPIDMHRSIDKLIAIDLDGTLLGPDNRIAADNIAAIRRAEQQNAAVVVCTGRPYVSADRIVCRIGLPEVPLIAFNGALIRWPCGGQVLYRCPVPADVAAEVVDECRSRDLHLNYYLDDQLYVTHDGPWARLYCQRVGMECKTVPDMRQFGGREPFKLLVADDPARIRDLVPQWRARWSTRLYITRSMPEYLEMLSPHASKGQALLWIAQFFGVDRQRTLAIGDAPNDLPLLQQAGFGAAMPDGDDQLKELADFVPDDQATGVAAAIDWFLDSVS